MPWNFDDTRPVYLQIIWEIRQRILTGMYQPGEKLPSVRDLAVEAAVNPNTMQRALSEMERDGLIHSERTSGRFVTDDMALIKNLQKSAAAGIVDEMLSRLEQTGLTKDEIRRGLKELGGEIVTIGSDAHTPDRVGEHTFRACEILKDIFGYVCTFEERKPIFHKL